MPEKASEPEMLPTPLPSSVEEDVGEAADAIQSAPVTPPPPDPMTVPDAERDSAGASFDPARHLRRKRKNGEWVKKPSGRPARSGKNRDGHRTEPSEHATPRGAPQLGPDPRAARPGSSPTPDAPVDLGERYRTNARATVGSLIGVATMLGGAEWQAAREEREAMIDAWTSYYQARGLSDLPPEAMLAMTMAAYVGPRLRAPETSSKLKRTALRVRDWWVSRRASPEPKGSGHASTDRGPDRERQDHTPQGNDAMLPRSRSPLSSLHHSP